MAYALSYLSIFNHQLDVAKMHWEMNNLMIIYGLSDMIYRGMTLVKFYAPNGVVLSEILHSCFCSHYNKTDVEVQQELGIGRTSFYKMKKRAKKIESNPEEFRWYDEYATLNFFKYICLSIGNLSNGEIEKMVPRLKKLD